MKLRRLLPLAVVPLVALAACGDDEGASDTTTAATVPARPGTTATGAETTEPAADTTTAASSGDTMATTAGSSDETMVATAGSSGETMATTAGSSDETMVATAGSSGETMATTAGSSDETMVATAGSSGETTATTAGSSDETTATTGGSSGDTTATTGGSTESSGSASSADLEETIVVGSADFSESQLLAQIYGQALERAGFTVDYQMSIGAREVYYGAMESGEINLVPEYTNSLLSFVLRQDDPEAVPDATNVDEQVAALDEALPDDLTVLTPSAAEDKDVIVCTADAAEEFGLTNLSSLFEAAPDITIGGPPEFEDRAFGISGFREQFDAEFAEFVPLAPAEVVDALTAGQIDCGNMFSTTPAITTEGLVALEDDVNLVPAEAILPLVATDVANPTLTETLDAVDEALTTDGLIELLVKVDVDKQAPETVASEFLDSIE